jgi:hypothetical protein
MEFLKQYLGDELYAQVAEKLTGNDKVKLANLADGALLDMGKISLDDSGKLVGADEQIKALQQSHAWAFAQTTMPGAGGNPPAPDQSTAEEAKMRAAAGLPTTTKTA